MFFVFFLLKKKGWKKKFKARRFSLGLRDLSFFIFHLGPHDFFLIFFFNMRFYLIVFFNIELIINLFLYFFII
jgi:hypothetical protein